MKPVDKSFFNEPCIDLAQKLIGHYIVHVLPSVRLVGRIVETEAYQGPEDRAAHSYNNRRTKRTEIMFNKPGYVYVYKMHTHTLINVVAGPMGIPHAVLIRAVEPVEGLEAIRQNRGNNLKEVDWTNGPGKLTQAFQITMKYYGHHWTKKPLYIAEGTKPEQIISSPRVGIKNTGEAAHYPWRFYEKENPFVSKFK